MEGGNRQAGVWAGSQPSHDQSQIHPTPVQTYPQVASFQVPVAQQHQRFAGGVTAGQSPSVPQLPGYPGTFQQPTLPGVVAPSPQQPVGRMFINANMAPLSGTAPMADVMRHQNLQQQQQQQQQQPSPQMVRYPVQISHHQKGWQDTRNRQRRPANQRTHQKQQKLNHYQNHPQQQQQHPNQHRHNQQQRQSQHQHQQQQAGDEAIEGVTKTKKAAATVGGGGVSREELQKVTALVLARMAPGGASVDLQKFQQLCVAGKWATSVVFELCCKMKPAARPSFCVNAKSKDKVPPFTVHISVNGVSYSPGKAQTVKIAKQLASVNFLREVVGDHPSNVNIKALKTGANPLVSPDDGVDEQEEPLEAGGDGGASGEMGDNPLSPVSVPGDYATELEAEEMVGEDKDSGPFVGKGAEERCGDVGGSGGGIKRKADAEPTIKREIEVEEASTIPDESPAAAGITTDVDAMKEAIVPRAKSLQFQRMYPGGVQMKSLHNFKVTNRPAVTVAFALCGFMVPKTRPEFNFLGDCDKGSGPFTMYVSVNGVNYSPGTGMSVKVARFEAAVNFIREVVGNRRKLDLRSFQPPAACAAAAAAAAAEGVKPERDIGDAKEPADSPNFLKLLHDLVTALPATESYTAFEWSTVEAPPADGTSGRSGGGKYSSAPNSDKQKNENSGNIEDTSGNINQNKSGINESSNSGISGSENNSGINGSSGGGGNEQPEVVVSGPGEPPDEPSHKPSGVGSSVGVGVVETAENTAPRFRCVAKLKLRVEEVEGGLKHSRETRAAKRLLVVAEIALTSSPEDNEALERWKLAQDKLKALQAVPSTRVDILTVVKEASSKKDAKVEAARAMAYKLLPGCENDRELRARAKSIVDEHREETKDHSPTTYLAADISAAAAAAAAAGATSGDGEGQKGNGRSASTDDKKTADNNGGWSMLMATLNNEGAEIDRLVADGASVVKQKKFWRGKSLLHLASERGCPEAVSALLRHGADANSRDKQTRTPLHLAAERGHLAVVRILLAAGADVYPRYGDRDCSAMDEAVCKGHVEVVEAIVLAGADPDAADCTNYRALHRAAYENQAESARVLLDKDVEVNPRDDDAATPVHFAAQQGSLEVLEVLLERGADPNAADGNQDSPLHLAVLYLEDPNRLFGVVEALLRWDADEGALNAERKRPIDLVLVPRVVTLLQRAPSVRRDRRWRRRGLLVLCRFRVRRPDPLGDGNGSESKRKSGTGRTRAKKGAKAADSTPVSAATTPRRAKLPKTDPIASGEPKTGGDGTASVSAANGNAAASGNALEWVVRVWEDKIFRTVVGFL